MDWATFARKVKLCQRGFMGEPEEIRPGRVEFNEFPSSCICQKPPLTYYIPMSTMQMTGRPQNKGHFLRKQNLHNDTMGIARW